MRVHSETPPFDYIGAPTPEPILGGYRTYGDMGWLDEEGYLFIADRRRDMIVSGGVNVFPAEVEAALSEHPGLADSAGPPRARHRPGVARRAGAADR
jgi:bile acid-coenzyme A ligase